MPALTRRNIRACYREPLWHTASVHAAGLSATLRHWLLDDGSLTRRLRAICTDDFSVKIVHQGWATPMINEARRLGIEFQRRVFGREVLLYCGKRAMVYARTLIPPTSLKGRLNRLAYLGEKPLGEILFTDPHIRRGELEIARLRPDKLLFDNAWQAKPCNTQTPDDKVIWARRSAFLYHGKRLLVSEIFLPNPEFGYGEKCFNDRS